MSVLLVDGDIFGWQRRGGVSRLYERMLPQMTSMDPQLRIRLAVPCESQFGRVEAPSALLPFVHWIPQMGMHVRPWRLWRRVRPAVNEWLMNAAWRTLKGDVFLSTNYTLRPVKVPSICIVYDMIFELFPQQFRGEFSDEVRRRKRLAVERAARVVCISRQTQSDVVRLLGVPQEKCRIVLPAAGVNPAGRLPYRKPNPKPYLLFIGDHESAYKNFRFVVDCLLSREFDRFRDLDLVVVSPYRPGAEYTEGPYSCAYRAGRFRFISTCDDVALADLYANCAALVYPSLYEGFGIPVIEALGFGTPVVCSNRASLPEAGGDAACYFDPESAFSFHDALSTALDPSGQDDRREKRVTQAARFSWAQTAQGLIAVMREVCS